jgi:asparagine synthase (glutamine-hydrolysing)
MAAEDLQVWVRDPHPLPVAASPGCTAILGHLFARSGSSVFARSGSSGGIGALPAAPRQAAARLVSQGWGAYVALLREAPGRYQALRDPTGALDALTWERDGVCAVAGDIDGLPPSILPSGLSLNWDVIASWVLKTSSLGGACGLEGLETIAPGELHPVGGKRAESVRLWRPLDWVVAPEMSEANLAGQLAARVEDAVAAWADAHESLLLEVSGGLDSAIVAAALGRGPGSYGLVGCLNYHADRPEADERSWARSVSAALSLPLTEVRKELRPTQVDDLAELAGGARPALNALDAERDRDTAARARDLGACAIVTGLGGDAVFFQMPTPLVLADYARGRPPWAFIGSVGQDVARWLRRSVWSVAAEARRGSGGVGVGAPSAFWGERVRTLREPTRHPWLDDIERAPPAKRLQLEALAATQASAGRSRRGQAAWLVHPLLAQPVLELCLGIPSWILTRGGRDRGLARDAFGAMLPPGLAERRSKGALSSFYARQAAASLDVLRPHLLDGTLVDVGILDRRAVEEALDADRLIWRADGVALLTAAAIESWVRHWQTRVPDAAVGPRFPA